MIYIPEKNQLNEALKMVSLFPFNLAFKIFRQRVNIFFVTQDELNIFSLEFEIEFSKYNLY